MQLSQMIGSEVVVPPACHELAVCGLTADSRQVKPGHVFVALPGARADGAQFIVDAISNGAIAVVVGDTVSVDQSLSVPVLRSREPRRALALMAARFYGAQPETAIAVTGTSGKTSVVEFTRQIMAHAGCKAASLGTLGINSPGGTSYGSLTTPDPVSLHETLADLAAHGVTHLAFEASSHGLSQHRMDGVRLSAAAFTNLGRDHLDYHSDIDDYFAAKMRLFTELLEPGQPVVISADGAYAKQALAVATNRGLKRHCVGRAGDLLSLLDVVQDGFAQRLTVRHGGNDYQVQLPLVGAYQVENALVAVGLALAIGLDVGTVLDACGRLSGVKGRLDVVGQTRGGLVVVDYAHKPEALEAALRAVRPFATGRLICVFGCGGDRDKGKRPLMGQIASQAADVVIVTDDNPRSEDAARIRAEILSAAPDALEIGDRMDAISTAVGMIGEGDVVVVAGKGHETGQIVGSSVLPFSDHEAIQSVLQSAA